MGYLVLLLLSATLAFGLEHWLKRWWISALAPLPIYLAYVWLEVNVLPFHRGGFPGWEAVLVFVAPIVVVGGAIGAPVARSRRRADRSEPSNALYPPVNADACGRAAMCVGCRARAGYWHVMPTNP